MSVIDNLKEALNGESNAKRKYELFAERAMEENHPHIAHVFKAVAFAESIHIKNHLRALNVITNTESDLSSIVKINEEELQGKIRDTKLNLMDALEGEIYETKKMYKSFEKTARKEKQDVAELSFNLARQAEKVHANIFSDLIKSLEKNREIESQEIYVCTICGNVEFKAPPAQCPVCDHSEKFFEKI